MNRRTFASVGTALLAMAALLVLLALMAGASTDVPVQVLAAPAWAPSKDAPTLAVPTVTEVSPTSAPNDLDTPIVVTGTGFAVSATVQLGDNPLPDAGWVSSATLTAIVPWGLDPGVYTLTVANPGEGSGSLPNAFTVTQGLGVWNAGELYGGNLYQIVVNPITPTILFAIADNVGLFRSEDSGESWSFEISSIYVEDVTVDPVSPNRVYRSGPPYSGGFLYRSDDAGKTWTPITATFPISQTSGRDCWGNCRVYANSGTVYAAACGGNDSESGLIKSEDAGETWTSIINGLTDTQAKALAFHPTDPLTMYLGTANGNVFISHDGGESWTFASQPLGNICQIAVSPFAPYEVWVATGWIWWGDPCGVLKSTNADLTAWTPVGEPARYSCGAPVLLAPEAWGEVYSRTAFIENHRTTDGGESWEPFGPAGGRVIALHPTDPDIIYVTEGRYGVQKTTDGGATWELANQGLTAIFPQALETVPGQPDTIFAQTNVGEVFKGTRGGAKWQRVPITTTESVLVDPVTTTRVYVGVNGGIYISDDGGESWPTFAPIEPPEAYTDCNHWPWLLLAVPGQPGTILAGVDHGAGGTGVCVPPKGSIYRSTDYGEHWSRVYPVQPQESVPFSDLACDALTQTIVYASRQGENMLKSTDAGLTWQPMGEGVAVLDHVLGMAVEPGPPYRVFANTATGLAQGLYLSDDHGASWRQADSPMIGYNIEQILFAANVPPVLYAGALQGLFRSADGAQSWQPAAGELGQVPVYSLATVTATGRVILYAGTTGGVVVLTGTEGTLLGAGVYRWTSRLPTPWLYLPLAYKDHAP